MTEASGVPGTGSGDVSGGQKEQLAGAEKKPSNTLSLDGLNTIVVDGVTKFGQVVDGEVRYFTVKELLDSASKVSAADARFNAAADAVKYRDYSLQFQKGEEFTDTQLKDFSRVSGLAFTDVKKMYQERMAMDTEQRGDMTAEKPGKRGQQASGEGVDVDAAVVRALRAMKLEDLPADIRERLELAERVGMRQSKDSLDQDIAKVFEENTDLQEILDLYDEEETKDLILEELQSKLEDRVRRQLESKRPYRGMQDLKEALSHEVLRIKRIANPAGQAKRKNEDDDLPGLGPVSRFPEQIQIPEKLPDRVAASESVDKYSANFVARGLKLYRDQARSNKTKG
jgi:hypothetical protein